jgi:hypothetical protein
VVKITGWVVEGCGWLTGEPEYDLGLAQGRMDLPGAGNCGDLGEVIQSR